MTKMEAAKRFLRDDSGLETVEWALILGFVILVAVVACISAGPHITTIFSAMTNVLDTAADATAGAYSVVAHVSIHAESLNLGSAGNWVTCYIELPPGYHIGDVVVGAIMLNGDIPAQQDQTKVGDYDGDGVPDLTVKFDRSAVQGIVQGGGAVTLEVTGQLTDGTTFGGRDTVVVQAI